ncbi:MULTISPECIES: hypothetical protein [unclassified Gordonia (in: high G+C Gram-positive bacteria)]|uniref:hypothetical protein n=1 Tax=unclassified Gordonia (in: high G+C Gram-positive bacteria) TaxID=2657482 RepID=UPI0001DD94C1|nr:MULTISPECIES: hypothetical protein [unclassified Gordonia (in: high G+C Gram-positive bacteria)]ADK68976.1 hypothetical protein KTR9_4895 [Gordonia sp. KTR9]
MDMPTPEWLLVTTFRGEIDRVMTTSRAPDEIIVTGNGESVYGQQLHRALGKPRKPLVDLARRTVRRAIAEQRPVVSEAIPVRGQRYLSIGSPVLSGRGEVFAVWLWTGHEGEVPTSPPMSAGWSWNIASSPPVAMYGPGVGDLYGLDLVDGVEYEFETITGLMAMDDIDIDRVAHMILSPRDGEQIELRPTVLREDERYAFRAMTQVVVNEDRKEWRGVTWDVTASAPPVDSPAAAAARAVAADGVWVVTAYWWPIAVVGIMGKRPPEILIDPDTHKAVPHESSKGVAAGMVRDILSGAETTSGRLSLLTTSGTFRCYDVNASRLSGATKLAATVSIRPTSPS